MNMIGFGSLDGIISAIFRRLIGWAIQVPLTKFWGQKLYCGTPYGVFLSLKVARVSKDILIKWSSSWIVPS